jgi:lipopolysaccharide biosynthesis glycosyltransferase
MKKVIVLAADKNYLEHVKSIIINCKQEGKWCYDFCLIANNIDEIDLIDFKKLGVYLFHINETNKFMPTIYIFDYFFKKWDYVMYLDLDIIIFDNLEKITIDLKDSKNDILVLLEPWAISEYFCQRMSKYDREIKLKELENIYDIHKFGFNAGFLYFNSNLIKKETLSEIIFLTKKYKHINNHLSEEGTDQAILNLYFNKNTISIQNDKFIGHPNINDKTICVHLFHKPWLNDSFCERYNKTFKEKYLENIIKFNTTVSLSKI